jgi:two-component system response regulator FlrC
MYPIHKETAPEQPFVFVDPASAAVFKMACKVGQSAMPVMITGPTGAGKEIMARVVHESSARADAPFIAINCSAITPTLAEDMLFGHEKGSFTGAAVAHAGCFEQADGGTLFLDEIGEMPLELQPKLLRVLQERKLTRIGGKREIEVNVRVVAATNINLQRHIESGMFREDLFYRLNTFSLKIPSLAARPMDIKPLALLLMQKYAEGRVLPELSEGALMALMQHSWPGNVRELENVMARAMLLCESDSIQVSDLMFDHTELSPSRDNDMQVHVSTLHQSTAANEYQQIVAAVRKTASRSEAADVLGISERTLRYKLQRMRQQGMDVPRIYSR